MNHTRYTIQFEAVASGRFRAPPLTRLKGLLKTSLRAWGLRAVSVTEHPAPDPAPATGQAPGQATPTEGRP